MRIYDRRHNFRLYLCSPIQPYRKGNAYIPITWGIASGLRRQHWFKQLIPNKMNITSWFGCNNYDLNEKNICPVGRSYRKDRVSHRELLDWEKNSDSHHSQEERNSFEVFSVKVSCFRVYPWMHRFYDGRRPSHSKESLWIISDLWENHPCNKCFGRRWRREAKCLESWIWLSKNLGWP